MLKILFYLILLLLSVGPTIYQTLNKTLNKKILIISIISTIILSFSGYVENYNLKKQNDENKIENKQIKDNQEILNNNDEYNYTSKVGFSALTIDRYTTDYTDVLNGIFLHKIEIGYTDYSEFKCSKNTLMIMDSIIKHEPRFPFTYYYRGVCEIELNLGNWEEDISKARSIFEVTTKIPGHNSDHDVILNRVEREIFNTTLPYLEDQGKLAPEI